MTRLTTCPDGDVLAARAVAEISRRLGGAQEERGIAHLALSGGRTPARTYELLAREPLRWEAVEVWFADERCVPPEDPESNYRLAAETLLRPAGVDERRIHRMLGELGPDEGAERYARALTAALPASAPERPRAAAGNGAGAGGGAVPTLDVIVLGIGEDGHVASLFPDAPTLDAGSETPCLGVHDSPKPPPERITLSLPVLRAAGRCLVLATGANKTRAVGAMLARPSRLVPASLLRRERLTVLVDDAAAPSPAAG